MQRSQGRGVRYPRTVNQVCDGQISQLSKEPILKVVAVVDEDSFAKEMSTEHEGYIYIYIHIYYFQHSEEKRMH